MLTVAEGSLRPYARTILFGCVFTISVTMEYGNPSTFLKMCSHAYNSLSEERFVKMIIILIKLERKILAFYRKQSYIYVLMLIN